MPDQEKQLYTKEVPDTLIASIRFRGYRQDLWDCYVRLRRQVETIVAGNPLCLRHGGNARLGFDMEICIPVSHAERSETLRIRTLPGGWMICTPHHGRSGMIDAEDSISKSWNTFYAALADRSVGLAEGPPREVYLLDGLEPGENSGEVIVELQEYLLLPRWLDRMTLGITRLAGEDACRRIMAGCENLTAFSPTQEKVRWVKETIRRLDEMLSEKARREIMAGCAHVFPEERIRQLRAEYHRLGDIDELLKMMDRDRSLGQYSYYGAPRREGQVIYETKNPQNPQGYHEAGDEREKRAHYCHCPIIKAAIRAGEPISPTFCYCGSGWFQRLWSGILEQSVRVEVVKTVLQGDDVCTFAVHLPPGVPKAGSTSL